MDNVTLDGESAQMRCKVTGPSGQTVASVVGRHGAELEAGMPLQYWWHALWCPRLRCLAGTGVAVTRVSTCQAPVAKVRKGPRALPSFDWTGSKEEKVSSSSQVNGMAGPSPGVCL